MVLFGVKFLFNMMVITCSQPDWETSGLIQAVVEDATGHGGSA